MGRWGTNLSTAQSAPQKYAANLSSQNLHRIFYPGIRGAKVYTWGDFYPEIMRFGDLQ